MNEEWAWREREIRLRAREASSYLERYRREKGAWWDDREQRLLVGSLPAGTRLRVLDAGAGVGRLTGALARRGYVIDSVDLSLESLRILAAAWSARGVRATVCDLAVGLPVRPGVYDGAVSAQTIHHIPARDGRVNAWAEIRRASRPGAVLASTVYHLKPWQTADGVHPNGPAYHRYSVADLRAELADAGWRVLRTRLCYRFEWKRIPAWLAATLDEAFARAHVLDHMATYVHALAVNA